MKLNARPEFQAHGAPLLMNVVILFHGIDLTDLVFQEVKETAEVCLGGTLTDKVGTEVDVPGVVLRPNERRVLCVGPSPENLKERERLIVAHEIVEFCDEILDLAICLVEGVLVGANSLNEGVEALTDSHRIKKLIGSKVAAIAESVNLIF